MTKYQSLFEQFNEAVQGLDSVLKQPKNEFIRDSAIKRFELVFDLSWKTIKAFCEEAKGIRCASPVSCFKEAYQQELIEYNDAWVKDLTEMRNKTVHTYDEQLAEEVYEKLPATLVLFHELVEKLKSQ